MENFSKKSLTKTPPALLIFLLFVLTGCVKTPPIENLNEDNNSSSDNQLLNKTTEEKFLTLDPNRCTGCGKCLQIDQEHFTWDEVGRTAKIASTANTESQKLNIAIAMCRTGAINFN